jgi:hypothetical protein
VLVHINRAFAYVDWCNSFPHHRFHALSSASSDHVPILLHTDAANVFHHRFMFESI